MLGPLAFLCALLLPGGVAAFSLNQPSVVVGRLGSSVTMSCTTSESVSYIHWYLHQEGSAPKRILMLDTQRSQDQRYGGYRSDKITAKKVGGNNRYELLVRKLEKRDEGVYYCAAWEAHSHVFPSVPCAKSPLSQVLQTWTSQGCWILGAS